MLIAALGTTAPEESVTVPRISAVVSCARAPRVSPKPDESMSRRENRDRFCSQYPEHDFSRLGSYITKGPPNGIAELTSGKSCLMVRWQLDSCRFRPRWQTERNRQFAQCLK